MALSSQDKPKQSLNSRIAYALTDRKILHFRYDAHLRQQVMKRLSKTQRELLNRLAAAGVDALPKKQLDTLLKELKQEVAKVYQEMTAYTQDELSGFFTAETQHIHQLYNDEVGFDFFNQVPEYKQKANKTATIIAGSPLEDWWAKQGNDFAFKFEGIIRQGLLDGQQTSQMISDVKHLMNTSRRHAETLVITAVAKVADNAHQALRDENLDILAGEKHLSTLDTRTSTVCQLRDGLMWDLDKKPIDHDVPYQRPPLHPRCRSILQLVTKSWKELGIDGVDEMPSSTRASQDGPVSEQINYENWLKSKSPEQQDQVLGKGKADLWRRGVITFADMLNQSGRPLTLKQLSVKLENGLLDTEQSLNQTTIELLDDLKAYNIEYRPVQMLSSQLSSDDIIAKLAGGDETKGSCASLALSYIGNRIGLDVTDYRGGKSCDFFSYKRNVKMLFSAKGVIAKEFEVLREAKGAADILNSELVLGREYYLSAGRHAAIVRRSNGGLEYLELQSKDKNGWMPFNKYGSVIKTLNKRFGCRLSPEKYSLKRKIQLAEVDSFKSAKQDLKEVLGYLNTAEDKQKKGVLGEEK
ncbi:minor capsid protein [Glaesserella parasuis]|uniref:minor capsid protein n=5 Tax=Glaesserella parasuis TaxID=738 RepID=UPI002367D87D|nr:minor capsid protein [Glaesserella parasuis]MDP0056936.1 minor capsid protein [Glaesserella parasuis]MDP0338036.1 minor capsid protein [Glaesserella parasuis]WDI29336.1 minor capsid protein [Glaesserella parasuis]